MSDISKCKWVRRLIAPKLSQAYARNTILDGVDLTNGILDRIDLTDASLKASSVFSCYYYCLMLN